VREKRTLNKYLQKAKTFGVSWSKAILPRNVVTAEWVRLKCQYGCGRYGTCLTCPPFSPTPEYTRKVLDCYRRAMLLVWDVPPDYKEKNLRRKMRRQTAALEREMFLDGFYKAFAMSCGPCNLCGSCDVSRPCRFEDAARPSMEACGIDVYGTLANAGYALRVVRSPNETCRFCGLLLID
jgi:predicted metal-binding protein